MIAPSLRAILVSFVMAILAAGCAARTMPRVDLSDAGWTVWNGQAVWRTGGDRPAIAGELIVATNAAGDVLINFSKPPFSIFTAQTHGSAWRIDFIERNRSYGGKGRPPRRFVWFYLPEILEGNSPLDRWSMESTGENRWTLTGPDAGESIELVFDR